MPTLERTPEQTPEGWSAVAEAYDRSITPFLREYALDLLERADLRRGEDVLDVAAGAGALSLAAADRGARVTAVDFAPAMVERLRSHAGDRVRCEVMDGQALRLEDGSFDAAFSNFGLIFFPDPVQGLREMHRVLRPGGRAAFTTWPGPPGNGMLAVMGEAMRRGLPGLEPPPPAWLRLAAPEACRAVMEEAGFQGVTTATTTHAIEAEDAEAFWRDLTTTNPVFPSLMGRLGPDPARRLHEAFVETLRERHGDGPVRVTNEANLVVGRR